MRDCGVARISAGTQLDVAHGLAGAFEEPCRIAQACSLKEAEVDVSGEGVDAGEGHVAEAGNGTAVVKDFAHFVAADAHDFKPGAGQLAELVRARCEPCVDGGVVQERVVEAQQLGFQETLSLSKCRYRFPRGILGFQEPFWLSAGSHGSGKRKGSLGAAARMIGVRPVQARIE
jgi:hypothetical protein